MISMKIVWINFNEFKKYIIQVINEEDDNNLTKQVKLDLLIKILDIEADEIKVEENNNIINTDIHNSIKSEINNDLNEEVT